jgi:hypothetical protein
VSARDRWPAAGGLPEAYMAGEGRVRIVVVVCGSGVVRGRRASRGVQGRAGYCGGGVR